MAPALGQLVACTWTGGFTPVEARAPEPVLPDGCIDIMWNGNRLFVAGPDTGPSPSTHDGRFVVGIRFRPGVGSVFLGPPAGDLTDRRLDLDTLWPHLGELEDRLATSTSLREAALVLEDHIGRRALTARRPDPVVQAVVRHWDSSTSRLPASRISHVAGVSERQMYRRFVDEVGYGPKVLERVLRFQRFLRTIAEQPAIGLAQLAADAGYADQAHLTRETRRLAGRTPAELRAARL